MQVIRVSGESPGGGDPNTRHPVQRYALIVSTRGLAKMAALPAGLFTATAAFLGTFLAHLVPQKGTNFRDAAQLSH